MSICVPEYIRALIFDCDGTLAFTEHFHFAVWNRVLESYGQNISTEQYEKVIGQSTDDILAQFATRSGWEIPEAEFQQRKTELSAQLLSGALPIAPVIKVLKSHFGKLPIAVVSNGSAKEVHATLKAVKVFDFLDCIITIDDGFAPKPSPEPFLQAASQLGVEAANCMVFEDSESGLNAGREAQMLVYDVRPIRGQYPSLR